MKIATILKATIAITAAAATFNADALQRWQNEKTTGNPIVFSERGDVMLVINYAIDGYENMYLYPMAEPNPCVVQNSAAEPAAPAYFNGVAVYMSHICQNGVHHFFPQTSQGRQYVMSLFFGAQAVTYAQGRYVGTFTAQGFTQAMSTFRRAKRIL